MFQQVSTELIAAMREMIEKFGFHPLPDEKIEQILQRLEYLRPDNMSQFLFLASLDCLMHSRQLGLTMEMTEPAAVRNMSTAVSSSPLDECAPPPHKLIKTDDRTDEERRSDEVDEIVERVLQRTTFDEYISCIGDLPIQEDYKIADEEDVPDSIFELALMTEGFVPAPIPDFESDFDQLLDIQRESTAIAAVALNQGDKRHELEIKKLIQRLNLHSAHEIPDDERMIRFIARRLQKRSIYHDLDNRLVVEVLRYKLKFAANVTNCPPTQLIPMMSSIENIYLHDPSPPPVTTGLSMRPTKLFDLLRLA